MTGQLDWRRIKPITLQRAENRVQEFEFLFCFVYSFILHFVSLYSDCETKETNSISWLVEINSKKESET